MESLQELALVLGAVLAGTAISSLLACIPGLHVFNVLGLVFMGIFALGSAGVSVPREVVFPLAASMLVGYSMLNTVPSVLLAAPDESALFTVLPGQKYLMSGRGLEGAMITSAGGLAGLLLLVVVLGPAAPFLLPPVSKVFQPHMHWIIWTVITFMLMSEWPKGALMGQGGWAKFFDGWKTTSAGLLTFLLSGLFGFILMYRSPIAPEVAFQNLLPAFVGLFTLPWLLINIASRVEVPPQDLRLTGQLKRSSFARGVFAGSLGGGFAAYFPVITGGVGGLLSGHATALRDDRAFLVSQGTSKVVYYVGALLLGFVPNLRMTRGGGAAMLKGFYTPRGHHDYYMVLAAIALSGMLAYLLVSPLCRGTIALVMRFGYRRLSVLALAVTIGLVGGLTGGMGLAVMAVATGIGLIPVLFGSRRMNCLGVILLPLACNMSGFGPGVARWLGLL